MGSQCKPLKNFDYHKVFALIKNYKALKLKANRTQMENSFTLIKNYKALKQPITFV